MTGGMVLARELPLVLVGAGGGEHGAAAHGAPWGMLFFMAINLALFVLVLRRYAWPLVRRSLRERHTAIRTDMEAAARLRQEAEALRSEWERKVAGLAAELEEMRRRAREEMRKERERILEEARRAAEAILADARRMAGQEFEKAARRLRAELAARALEAATRRAREQLTDEDHRRFVRRFVEQVGS